MSNPIHLATDASSAPLIACSYRRPLSHWRSTTDVSKVTCKRCLRCVAPVAPVVAAPVPKSSASEPGPFYLVHWRVTTSTNGWYTRADLASPKAYKRERDAEKAAPKIGPSVVVRPASNIRLIDEAPEYTHAVKAAAKKAAPIITPARPAKGSAEAKALMAKVRASLKGGR